MAPHVLSTDPVKAPEPEKSKPNLGGATTQDLRVPIRSVESSDDLSSLSKRDIIIFSGLLLPPSPLPTLPRSKPFPPENLG